jgi:7-cyano-7-deazaguanine synthase
MSKPIVLFSGGLDSAVLLWKLREGRKDPKAISFDYGQRHRRELQNAFAFTDKFDIEHEIGDLRGIAHLIKSGSQTGSDPVPEGHYAEESMKKTIVPNRNMIFLAIAIGWAQSTGSTEVFYAAHAGDHAIYPDCRPDFFEPLTVAAYQSSWPPHVRLRGPFLGLSKAQIVQQGAVLNTPFELTYSCYNGRQKHCGKCGTCVERKEAFQLAGVADPTEYE